MRLLLLALALLTLGAGPDADYKDSSTAISYSQLVEDFGYGIITVDGETLIVPAEFAQGYLPIMACESDFKTDAVSPTGCLGLMQLCKDSAMLKVITGMSYVWMDMLDAVANVRVAAHWWTITGRNWSHWECKP